MSRVQYEGDSIRDPCCIFCREGHTHFRHRTIYIRSRDSLSNLQTVLKLFIPEISRQYSRTLIRAIINEVTKGHVSVEPSNRYLSFLTSKHVGLTEAGVCSTMKLYVGVTLVVVASLIHTAMGLSCEDLCAACWKDNDPNGTDIKMQCNAKFSGGCGNTCPSGYSGIHCAQSKRCQ